VYLAPVQLALHSRVHRNQGPITEESSASFVGHPTRVYVLVYAQYTTAHRVNMHDTTDEWRSEEECT
jgi:hypothetical protein